MCGPPQPCNSDSSPFSLYHVSCTLYLPSSSSPDAEDKNQLILPDSRKLPSDPLLHAYLLFRLICPHLHESSPEDNISAWAVASYPHSSLCFPFQEAHTAMWNTPSASCTSSVILSAVQGEKKVSICLVISEFLLFFLAYNYSKNVNVLQCLF